MSALALAVLADAAPPSSPALLPPGEKGAVGDGSGGLHNLSFPSPLVGEGGPAKPGRMRGALSLPGGKMQAPGTEFGQ